MASDTGEPGDDGPASGEEEPEGSGHRDGGEIRGDGEGCLIEYVFEERRQGAADELGVEPEEQGGGEEGDCY